MLTTISCCVDICCFSILIGSYGWSFGSSNGLGLMIFGLLLKDNTCGCLLGLNRGFVGILFSSELQNPAGNVFFAIVVRFSFATPDSLIRHRISNLDKYMHNAYYLRLSIGTVTWSFMFQLSDQGVSRIVLNWRLTYGQKSHQSRILLTYEVRAQTIASVI